MPPELVVLSRVAAEGYAPGANEVCISIADPDAAPVRLAPGFRDVLRLGFNDLARASTLSSDVVFGPEQAREILDFLAKWPDAERVVIHCLAGVSRSPGVAMGICDVCGWSTEALEAQFPHWNTLVRSELAKAGRGPAD